MTSKLEEAEQILKKERETLEQLRSQNQNLKKELALFHTTAEHEEEYIANTLLKRIDTLQKEKENLSLKISEEEEVMRSLQSRLSQLQAEKVSMEQTLEVEQEQMMNRLQKQLDDLKMNSVPRQRYGSNDRKLSNVGIDKRRLSNTSSSSGDLAPSQAVVENLRLENVTLKSRYNEQIKNMDIWFQMAIDMYAKLVHIGSERNIDITGLPSNLSSPLLLFYGKDKRSAASPTSSKLDPNTRIKHCKLLLKFAAALGLPYYSISTSLYLYHRLSISNHKILVLYYERIELVLIACLSLAMKIEETVKRLQDIYSTVLIVLGGTGGDTGATLASGEIDPKEMKDVKDIVMDIERILLQDLQFDVDIRSPHRFTLSFLKLLGIASLDYGESLAKECWDLINTSYLCQVSIIYPAHIISLATILCSHLLHKKTIPTKLRSPEFYAGLACEMLNCVEAAKFILDFLFFLAASDEEKIPFGKALNELQAILDEEEARKTFLQEAKMKAQQKYGTPHNKSHTGGYGKFDNNRSRDSFASSSVSYVKRVGEGSRDFNREILGSGMDKGYRNIEPRSDTYTMNDGYGRDKPFRDNEGRMSTHNSVEEGGYSRDFRSSDGRADSHGSSGQSYRGNQDDRSQLLRNPSKYYRNNDGGRSDIPRHSRDSDTHHKSSHHYTSRDSRRGDRYN